MSQARSGRCVGGYKTAALLLLALFLADRLLLIFGQPDLLHDLDPGELKHMQLAIGGLSTQDGWLDAIRRWVSGPENIHHGGFPVVSLLFAVLSKVFGENLQTLRLIPIFSSLAAAALIAVWLRRRGGDASSLLALALLLGAPLLFLKWTCVARGGHTEAVLFAPLLLVFFERSLRSTGPAPWLLAGASAGFAVYFSYLTIPLVLVLSAAALAEGILIHKRRLVSVVVPLGLGGLIGFSPWLFGWLVLDLPYFDATIHASANPSEASEVARRGLLGGLRGAFAGLPHNLWPWTFTELQSPAYLTEPTDLLPFDASPLDWASRGLISLCGLLALTAAFARRSPMTVGLALLPALHYLFVIRLANPGAWPDIPHRYLVVVFPVVVANAALGTGWLLTMKSPRLRRVGQVLALALIILAGVGLSSHSRWWQAPDTQALASWDVASYREQGLGQIRLSDARSLGVLRSSFHGQLAGARIRGVSRIYPGLADYYLLWRAPSNRAAPYPNELFLDLDPGTPDDERRAVVEGAYAATTIRSGGDEELLDRWLCSWRPGPQFEEAVASVLREQRPVLPCLVP